MMPTQAVCMFWQISFCHSDIFIATSRHTNTEQTQYTHAHAHSPHTNTNHKIGMTTWRRPGICIGLLKFSLNISGYNFRVFLSASEVIKLCCMQTVCSLPCKRTQQHTHTCHTKINRVDSHIHSFITHAERFSGMHIFIRILLNTYKSAHYMHIAYLLLYVVEIFMCVCVHCTHTHTHTYVHVDVHFILCCTAATAATHCHHHHH